MGAVSLWTRAMRAPFFTASAMSVVVGTACAWHFGAPHDWLAFVLALAGVVALHGGANLANDYYDHLSGNDEANRWHNAFSGGSRLIQDGIVPPRRYLAASLVSFAFAAGCAAYLQWTRGGWQISVLGTAGLLLGFLYTATPTRLVYRGIGEAAIFAAFGPLATAGSYFVQAGRLDIAGYLSGVPVGLLVALILIVNEFPDFEADSQVGKGTLIVRLGLTRGWYVTAGVYLLSYAAVAAVVAAGGAPQAALWTLATLPLPAAGLALLWRYRFAPPRLVPASAAGILTHFAFSAVLAAAYLLSAR